MCGGVVARLPNSDEAHRLCDSGTSFAPPAHDAATGAAMMVFHDERRIVVADEEAVADLDEAIIIFPGFAAIFLWCMDGGLSSSPYTL